MLASVGTLKARVFSEREASVPERFQGYLLLLLLMLFSSLSVLVQSLPL